IDALLLPEHDVGGLQVAMDYPVHMRFMQRQADLLGNSQRTLEPEAAVLLDLVGQRTVAAVLHGEEELTAGKLAEIEQPDEVVVIERTQNGRFALEPLHEPLRADQVSPEDLDDCLASNSDLIGEIDRPEAPFADPFQDRILTERCLADERVVAG